MAILLLMVIISYSLADLPENGGNVDGGDVPVVDDAALLEPLLRLRQRYVVSGRSGLPVLWIS